jgi:hypothetical protein
LSDNNQKLLTTRSRIQTDLAVHAQIRRLEELKKNLSSTPEERPPVRSDDIREANLVDFQHLIRETLQSWQVPGENHVLYDQKTAEIVVDNRDRQSRGKGMRSIIHAAFSTALALYATSRDLPHPGFVVLDSPVLTYREPHEDDVQLTRNVVEHFYRGLLNGVPTQTVIVENSDPPSDLEKYATVHAFSAKGSDRTGFFPPLAMN